jgi:xylulokinase
MNCLLGIDVGTSGIKAVVIDEDGKTLGTGYQENDVVFPAPLMAEQTPQDWWTACRAAVRQAVSQSGAGRNVRAVGVTGQMLGSVLLDHKNEPVDRCIIWLDQRATEELEAYNRLVPAREAISVTGNIALTSLWAPKLMWLKKHRPDVFAKTRRVVFPKDYIIYRLTGELSTEVTDASGTALMDVYHRSWSRPLFERCGIPYELVVPELRESRDVVGYLRPDVADDLGLCRDAVVTAGAGDQSACGVGAGAVREGIVSATIGTSGVVFAATNRVVPDTNGKAAMAYCHALPQKWCLFGCTLGAGGSFKWLRDTFFAREKAELTARGLSVYDHMTALAGRSSVGAKGCIFLPYLNGERTPHPDPRARGVFFGLSYRHGLEDMTRAVMEGVTMSLRDTIEILRAAGIGVEQVRAAGGGAKSALWLQMQADIFNAEIVCTNIEETGCVGAAIIAGVGAGIFEDEAAACARLIKPVQRLKPKSGNVGRYDELYALYAGLYGSLKNDFQRLGSISHRFED